MAQRVMGGVPDPNALDQTLVGGASVRNLQRLCSNCQAAVDEPMGGTQIHRMCSQCDEELHRKGGGRFRPSGAELESEVDGLRGEGQPLPVFSRNFFEGSFGLDFSRVRVHTSEKAAKTAQSIQALAYTTGNDIVFAPGQYRPETHAGRQLIAHELTHVVQQSGGSEVGTLSNGLMQRTCGPAAIGAPVGCAPATDEPVGELVMFTVNCDDFASAADQQKVVDFADSMAVGDRVRVHGFASTDGNPAFNSNLSCARALRAVGVLMVNGIGTGQIEILRHGATPGSAATRRSIVLERIPGASRPTVPQLNAAIVTPPTPGLCGDENFVIQWVLSRNSNAANGGFVIQDVTIDLTDVDCAGAMIPRGFVFPLHYFEAWQVNPGSTTFNPADGNTDTFAQLGQATTCATGRLTFSGTATYHDSVAALPPHMVRGNAATAAGPLRSSLTDPAIGGSVSRPVTHNVTVHWDCCPCSSSPTVVDSHTP